MRDKDLYIILKKIIIILLFSFIFFIIVINISKFVIKDKKIKLILKQHKEQQDIDIAYYKDKNINKEYLYLDQDKSHTSSEIGFHNYLYEINGSEWNNGINILLVGSDKKDFYVDKARADVIIVIRITETGKILTISIPRDSLIMINNGKWYGEMDKIGHSLYWGGMNNLKRNVENIIGSPIDRVAIVDNFKNLEAFMAILGGIKIDKVLFGKLGVQWIRNRNFADGDIERCRRQQVFIKRAAKKIWSITDNGNYFISSYFYEILKKIIYTDISKNDFNHILYTLKNSKFNPENDFYTGVLPGQFGTYDSKLLNRNNLTCWILDEKILKEIRLVLYAEKRDFLFEDNNNVIKLIKLDVTDFFSNIIKLFKKNNK